MIKHQLTMRETWVQFLGWEDLLEKEMVTHSSTIAWRIPWTEEPGRLQSMGSERVRHDWATSVQFSSRSAIRVAYIRSLIFLLAILIPARASSGPPFLMKYSACKLNKQADNIQPWLTPFPIWSQSLVPFQVLTVTSWPAYRFLRREIRRSVIPISLRIFYSLLWST